MAKALSHHELSKLIGSIYDCALDPERWEHALAGIRDALDAQTAVLRLDDLANDRLLIYRTVGIEPYWLEQQAKHIPEIHARLLEDLSTWPSLDMPHVVSRHVPQIYLETSRYFQEWLKPQGLVDVMSFFLIHTPTRLAGFALARHERQGIITEHEIKLGGLLLPHVRRSLMISNMLDVGTVERAGMAEALDALTCAVVLTNERGAVLHANRSAKHMLRSGSPIQDVRGILQAKIPSASRELHSAIMLAAHDEVSIGKTGLAVLLSESGLPPVFARVLPMAGDLRAGMEPAAVAAVFIGNAPDEHDAADMLATAFGLTLAETRVLASLVAGHTLAETAASLHIANATAKTHLDNIFQKTGASRQADLMRLVMQIVPPAGQSGP
ncbi:MAG: helix-turn-helix transcriptional regulator [Mesorhizobium sp.]|uniref:helix-turn-helix transcriptional regulator n=1 Tax=Mesorhizobium sp. TaxID=1871066 RepID=UPI000FEA753C|nr:LuxR C-terminal-related transcriptional regulator [Mesorhizobium sp.]RWM90181.1 MAG: helix-turn-helix transcriptional regulator [Mesorhizobium sp.]